MSENPPRTDCRPVGEVLIRQSIDGGINLVTSAIGKKFNLNSVTIETTRVLCKSVCEMALDRIFSLIPHDHDQRDDTQAAPALPLAGDLNAVHVPVQSISDNLVDNVRPVLATPLEVGEKSDSGCLRFLLESPGPVDEEKSGLMNSVDGFPNNNDDDEKSDALVIDEEEKSGLLHRVDDEAGFPLDDQDVQDLVDEKSDSPPYDEVEDVLDVEAEFDAVWSLVI